MGMRDGLLPSRSLSPPPQFSQPPSTWIDTSCSDRLDHELIAGATVPVDAVLEIFSIEFGENHLYAGPAHSRNLIDWLNFHEEYSKPSTASSFIVVPWCAMTYSMGVSAGGALILGEFTRIRGRGTVQCQCDSKQLSAI